MSATCTTGGTITWHCDVCDGNFIEITSAPLGHSFKSYVSDSNATCTADGTKTATCDRADCGATDTIADPGSALGHNFTSYVSGGNATCTADGTKTATCDRAGCGATDTIADSSSVLGHSFTSYVSDGNATCTADGTKTATCDRAGCGVTKTITDPGSALGHDYKAARTSPTCTKCGYTTYTCTRCSDSYEADKTASRGHWFGEWTSNGDGTHAAYCLRDGCNHVGKTGCETFTCPMNGTEITLCPVCGGVSTGERMLLLENATAKAVTQALPSGELALRRSALADGTEVIIVSFEYAGKVEQPNGIVKITLPEEALKGYNLMLLNADGMETAISYTVEDGLLTFELDFTPVEGTEYVPATLMRLVSISK